ncbi:MULTISPECIES: hydrolase 1, exosortase A system-associated [unclassified Thioalkalivibrio]|uniref:hydrolase 1, exosortase A system-associated n=1 Tax=unclassified Thioalkalivibrio TaxID=2621013 RepID=UPI00037C7C05|nr:MULTISPECIES: hydrolase 1, exosortase A system-associated [unclassified Thioalkalivibrio]
MNERAVVFRLGGEELLGILHPGAAGAARGVLIAVGGPQYRVGSHRQFLLLARDLAARGIPVFRFDFRGMGDASGAQRDYEEVHDDLRAAMDTFSAEVPGMREVVIWGLCGAASAALFYAWRDPRVAGLVLANPWVRTDEGLARAYLKTYYLQRLVSRDFWSGALKGRFNPWASLRSLGRMVGTVLGRGTGASPAATDEGRVDVSSAPLPDRMAEGWCRFRGPILLVLSGEDLTAAEFRDVASHAPAWDGLLRQPRVTLRELPDANHTFSRREWRDQVATWTHDWLRQAPGPSPG